MNEGATFDYDVIRKCLDEEEWEPVDDWTESRSTYLGTVFSLIPSGKYYMPWCSNFTDEEAQADEEWLNKIDKEFTERNIVLINGEGDPCDLFAAEYRDIEPLVAQGENHGL
jgi:hypothetical protein